jgi:hypothetical protein
MIGRPNVLTILLWELYILGSKCKPPWELSFMVMEKNNFIGKFKTGLLSHMFGSY